jgi:hypothetical protein
MSVISTASTSKSVDLEAKAAAASAALVEKMRAAEAAKAAKAKEREEAKAAKEAEKAAEKAAKEAEKAALKAAKEAEKAAEKAAKAAEKAAKKAAKEAEEAAKPKRPVGRPRKAAGGAGAASTASSVLDDLREPLPAITPAMRKRIAAAESVDMEIHPSLFGTEPTTVEEANAVIASLHAQLAALSEAFSHQKAVIRGSMELLSAVPI